MSRNIMIDENNDSCNDILHSFMSISSELDSGYLTFTSPSRLSPSIVAFSQFDSPISEDDIQSPIKLISQNFVSTIDYEQYVSTRKHFDIITQLSHRNAFHLIDEILKNLSNNNLYSCSHVCRKWNYILKDYHRRKQTKHVKRNLFHNDNNETSPIKYKKFTSTPLQTITNSVSLETIILFNMETTNAKENGMSSQNEDNIHLAASTMSFRYGYLKYLHGPTITKRCPLCAFVSIVDINDNHGICTNPLCRNNFCQCCSGPYHPSSPCKTTTGPIKSPWRKRATISPIFSNKTRKNLQRLLMR